MTVTATFFHSRATYSKGQLRKDRGRFRGKHSLLPQPPRPVLGPTLLRSAVPRGGSEALPSPPAETPAQEDVWRSPPHPGLSPHTPPAWAAPSSWEAGS